MSVTPSSTIVGVFRDRSAAEQAVDALYNAGFGNEQIQYSVPSTSGSFFEGLKSFFTGTSDSEGNLANDLTNMGLSDEEAQYYSNEYNNGNTILIVRAAGRETEAMNVLRQYGAYNAETEPGSFSETATDTQQPGDNTQQDDYATSGQYNDAQDEGTQLQSQMVEEHPFVEPQLGNVAPEQDGDYQNTQPMAPVNETEPQDTQASVIAPEHGTVYQASQTDTVNNEQESETPTSQPSVAAPYDDEEYLTAQATEVAPEHDSHGQGVESIMSGYESGTQNDQVSAFVPGTDSNDQATQVDRNAPEQESGSQIVLPATTDYDTQPPVAQAVPETPGQEAEIQPLQASAVSPEQTDELQQLHAQIQTLQQQLQEAKTQLQAAQEQEGQIKAAREREQQLQSARQQVQDLQAELQATVAELQETQSRIAQYQ